MLNESELAAWYRRLNLNEQARMLINRIRSSEPARRVAGKRSNVSGLLAIIGKRRFLDCGRGRSVNNIAELETQVREIAAGRWVFPKFIKDRLEVGQ